MLSKRAVDQEVSFGMGPKGKYDQDVREADLGVVYVIDTKGATGADGTRNVRQLLGYAGKRTGAKVETKVDGTKVYWRVVSRDGNVVSEGGGRPPAGGRSGATPPGRTGRPAPRPRGKQ